MGMAASQARYLALTARKSNVEFQGQQINQQRTLLAIEQGELFSELTKLKNPIPPSKVDYTYDVYTFNAAQGGDDDTAETSEVTSESETSEYRIIADTIKETSEIFPVPEHGDCKVSEMTIKWTDDKNNEYEDTIKGALIGSASEYKGYSDLYVTYGGAIANIKTDAYVDDLTKGQWIDEDAYEDAMNKYTYERDVYNHEVENINAKTEQIQIKDRTLELKLRNLDTEQNALQTELESVKKVIEDTVQTVFKTFQSS